MLKQPPGYYASISFGLRSQEWTGNFEVIRLMRAYGENLENASVEELELEMRELLKTSASRDRNEALLVLAHALAD